MIDENGWFDLTDVPRERVKIDVGGESVVPRSFEIPATGIDNLRLEVAQRCHFRVIALGNVSKTWHLEIRNVAGEALPIYRFRDRAWSSSSSMRMNEESSQVLAVSEDGVQLAVTTGFRGETLTTQTISLVPGEVQQIQVTIP